MRGIQFRSSFKPKYQDKANPRYMDADNVIVNIRTEYVYKDMANDVEKRSDTLRYEV